MCKFIFKSGKGGLYSLLDHAKMNFVVLKIRALNKYVYFFLKGPMSLGR